MKLNKNHDNCNDGVNNGVHTRHLEFVSFDIWW